MNREFSKISLIIMVLVAGVAVAGTGFGLWTGALDVAQTVNTGTVNLEFVNGFTDDDGVVDDLLFDKDDIGTSTSVIFDFNGPLSSADPGETGVDPKLRYDKDVARCLVTGASQGTGAITKENVYPGYNCTTWFDVANTGTVPVKIKRVTLSGAQAPINVIPEEGATNLDLSGDNIEDVEVEITDISLCQQIDPGASVRMNIDQRILQPSPQGASLGYSVEVEVYL